MNFYQIWSISNATSFSRKRKLNTVQTTYVGQAFRQTKPHFYRPNPILWPEYREPRREPSSLSTFYYSLVNKTLVPDSFFYQFFVSNTQETGDKYLHLHTATDVTHYYTALVFGELIRRASEQEM